MKTWLLRISVTLCAMAVLLTGSWWVWREWWSAEQFSEAVRASRFERAKFLYTIGASTLEWRENDSFVYLQNAVSNGDIDRVRRFLSWGAKLKQNKYPSAMRIPGYSGQSVMKTAAYSGEKEIIQLLRSHGIPYDIDMASLAGDYERVQEIIQSDADARKRISGDSDALRNACTKGHIDVVKLLIDSGANIDAQAENGLTPISFSVLNNHNHIILFLLSKGANVNLVDVTGRNPLHRAAMLLDPTTVRMLVDAGTDLKQHDQYGHTPLYYAKKIGIKEIIKILSLERIMKSKDMEPLKSKKSEPSEADKASP